MKVLALLGAFAALIAGQDTNSPVFPPNGNGSSSVETVGGKIEPDMTRVSASPWPPMLPSDYFFPGKDFSILVTLRRRLIALCARL